jgi:hypothetical protein
LKTHTGIATLHPLFHEFPFVILESELHVVTLSIHEFSHMTEISTVKSQPTECAKYCRTCKTNKFLFDCNMIFGAEKHESVHGMAVFRSKVFA